MNPSFDAFTWAYIGCALWSSFSDLPGGNEYTLDDLAPETVDRMVAECATFQAENPVIFTKEYPGTPEQAGHDFWLTRNGHGAGFWDRGHGEVEQALTVAAHAFGECDLYVGDDGKLYL